MTTADPEETKRRGRPPMPPEERKSTNLKFRTRAGIREKLEAEAERKNRSVSEEVEWRIEKSFDYESVDSAVNEAFLRYMRVFFGSSNNPLAIAIMASFWQRAINTANRQIHSDEEWFDNELKQKIMTEVMQRGVKAAIKEAADDERHKAAQINREASRHATSA